MTAASLWIRDCTDADASTGALGAIKPAPEAELAALEEELPPSPRATGAAAVLAVVLAMVGAAALAIASPGINESLTESHLPAASVQHSGPASGHANP